MSGQAVYSYVGNDPLNLTDPSGKDFYQSCSTPSATCGSQQVGNAKTNVVGTTDENGKFAGTVVTSASLSQQGSGNTATVNGSGVQVTTSTGTAAGVFIPGTPSANIAGDAKSGWGQFSFNINGSDLAHGVSASGTASYSGPGGHAGMVNAIQGLKAGGHSPFNYPSVLERFSHPGATNYRFSSGDYPSIFDYGPSAHFPVTPQSGTGSDFHVDMGTGPWHVACTRGDGYCN